MEFNEIRSVRGTHPILNTGRARRNNRVHRAKFLPIFTLSIIAITAFSFGLGAYVSHASVTLNGSGVTASSTSGNFLELTSSTKTLFGVNNQGNVGANQFYGSTVSTTPAPNLSFASTGGLNLNAGGTNQNLNLNPSGSGYVKIGAQGLQFPNSTVMDTAGIPVNAIYVSPNCGGRPNCYQVYDDAQVAMTANWTYSSPVSTTTQAQVYSDNVSALAYGQVGSGPIRTTFSMSGLPGGTVYWAQIAAGFKASGTIGYGHCWQSGLQSTNSSTITVSISPTGGSGHLLVVGYRGGGNPTSVTFSDPSNGTWTNLLSSPLLSGTSFYIDGGYVLNPAAGTYTLTAQLGSPVANTSLIVCEYSGIASSPLDNVASSAGEITSGTTATSSAQVTLASSNDLLVSYQSATNPTTAYTATFGFSTGGTTSPTITTQSSDPSFTSSDVGDDVVLTTGCDLTNGGSTCTNALPAGGAVTIASVNGPHSVTLSSGPIVAPSNTDGNFTGWMAWGHNDASQLAAAFAASLNTPGGSLILPCGAMMIGSPPFDSNSSGGAYSSHIEGCPNGLTTLIPTNNFDYAAASGGIVYNYTATNMSGFGVSSGGGYLQNTDLWSTVSNIHVWGMGVDGSNVTTALPVFSANGVYFHNVWVTSFNWKANVTTGEQPAYGGEGIYLDHSGSWGTADGWTIDGSNPSDAFSNGATNCYIGFQLAEGPSGSHAIYVPTSAAATNLDTRGCRFNGTVVTGAALIDDPYLTWNSSGDEIGGVNDEAGSISLKGDFLATHDLTIDGGTASAMNTLLQGGVAMSAGSFTDNGGNYHCSSLTWWACHSARTSWSANSSNNITGGQLIGDGSITGVALSTSSIGFSTNWGTSTTVSSLNGSTRSGQFTVTLAGTSASPMTGTLTFPVPFATAPSGGCSFQQIGGTQSQGSVTTGAVTATTAQFVWTGSNPTSGNTIIIRYECSNP